VVQVSPEVKAVVEEVKKKAKETGVSPTTLEVALTDEQYHIVLEHSKEEWAKLPKWKQEAKKKAVGLF